MPGRTMRTARSPRWTTRSARALLAAALLWPEWAASAGTPASAERADLTPEQTRRIVALGPWPPPWRADPSNRLSGRPRAIEFGRLLFRDARLAPLGYIACVTCHQPDRAFTDWKPRAHGLADLPRNTPALFNLRLQSWYGWGGASDSLWLASIRPILDAREFDGSAASVVQMFVRDEQMAACYRAIFGASPLARPERTLLNVGKSIAAYVETLASGRTPFDEYRDALARGDAAAATAYPAPARRGLAAFVGTALCVACHAGPNFSDGRFHAGAPAATDGARDRGRLEDARTLAAHPLNLASAANDDRSGRTARAMAHALRAQAGDASLEGRFRTPSLRNVAVTAPYLHDGRAETLQDAIRAHAPQPLPAHTLRDLEAFLYTLTDRDGARRPWTPSQLTPSCR
jgi:cytochrome c peroxidase